VVPSVRFIGQALRHSPQVKHDVGHCVGVIAITGGLGWGAFSVMVTASGLSS
jgi:hypothetical protein